MQNLYMNSYLGQYPQFQSPYNPMMTAQQRLSQMEQQYPQFAQQSMQPQQQQAMLSGRIVDNVATVNANEVPMDGSMSIFPKSDMSEIYVKSWNTDGTIKTVVFRPIAEQNPQQIQNDTINAENIKIELNNDVTEAFMKRFDDIDKKIGELETSLTKSSTKSAASKAKKESEA